MKAAVFKGPGKFEVVDMPIPQAESDQIVVRVEYCGICGSDLHTYTEGLYVQPGQVMGHEFAGVVAEVGSEIKDIYEGDRVVVRPLIECGTCRHCMEGRPHLCANGLTDGIGYGRAGCVSAALKYFDSRSSIDRTAGRVHSLT